MKLIVILLLISSNAMANFLQAPFPKFTGSIKSDTKGLEQRIEDFGEVFQTNVSQVMGRKFVIKLNKENFDFNAYATIDENEDALIMVNMGMLNHPEMQSQILDLFMCHELGHLLGGEPKLVRPNNRKSWSSVEGQADYYATKECMSKLGYTKEQTVHHSVQLAQLIARMRGYHRLPSIEQKDQTRPGHILQTHPNPQCRLDTFIAGLNLEQRPLCWYDNEL